MEIIDLPLSGAKLVRPRVFHDARGFFFESYSEPAYHQGGINERWVQDNHSRSARNTLRGLHYQSRPGQAKLVRVTVGRIFDVFVDIRPHSATFGKWHGLQIDAEDHSQVYIPVGFAHGFCVMSEVAEVQYKVSSPYDGTTECGMRWDDPEIGVLWPILQPLLSTRDQAAESFAELKARLESLRR